MEQILERVPLSITYITYVQDDKLGKILALASLAPILIIVLEVAFIIAPHQSSAKRRVAVMLLVGQLINEGINAVLKEYFREPRPLGSDKLDYGMPSSHSQFMGYLAAIAPFFVEFTIFRVLPFFIVRSVFPVFAWIVGFSRVYLNYHDIRQVAVGFFLGVAFGIAWTSLLKPLSRENVKKSV